MAITPRQQRLQFAPASSGRLAKIKAYEQANLKCAEIVASDIQKFGGWDSLMGRWASAILHGFEGRTREWRRVA